ncbi:peptidylprolyl isomerase [Salinispirillum marinum]|uniref:Peptidyl-prolyl cis-trans isomerase n=2 Tax=Saccharospirillaceae TaxID=255527 RepID=A0ABV8BDQ2_9GAMM
MNVLMKTSMGDVTLELFEDKAPVTVANFVAYVKDGFYDGLIFHRIIDGFMIQGGGFEPGMKQKTSGEPIKNEANNGVANDVGTIAMARTMDPHSATAQFFINVSNNSFLNHRSETMDGWGYAAFGKVTEGMDVVNQIKAVKTGISNGHQDVPLDDVVILSMSVLD